MFSQSCSDDSASVPPAKSPTLLTMTSVRPNRSTTVFDQLIAAPASVMSVSTARNLPTCLQLGARSAVPHLLER